MTREKEITKEAKKFVKEIDDWEIAEDVQDAFEVGAQWADAHPNWISIDDAYPEEDEVVIAFDDRQGTLFTKRQTIIERNLYTKSNKITHWMRIPAPPKAE